MARTTPACRRDLACYRNDGHAGDHAYATPDTVPSPAPIWQAGYDAGYREAQEDIAAGVQVAAPPSDPAAPLDVERLARALRNAIDPDLTDWDVDLVAREYAALTPAPASVRDVLDTARCSICEDPS